MTLPNQEKLCEFNQLGGEAFARAMLTKAAVKPVFCGGLPYAASAHLRQVHYEFKRPYVTSPSFQRAVAKLLDEAQVKELRWVALASYPSSMAPCARALFVGPFRLMWYYNISTDSVTAKIDLCFEPQRLPQVS